ncbi:head-tail adaptor protein [Paracoccus sp. Z330]|uniref:Head-tail adaptor protein n=1 Tax=Paracoccus onchidii TaxID=3017813 RepID=A0ABT4ZF94_9RHOB|nr:head-tail adaptor protein [Paracoccus onchidii]MDB6178029.1 head-tail adaptor protein [Paracoccus onchidii]
MIRLELEDQQRDSDGLGGHVVTWRRLGALFGEMDSGSGRRRSAQVGAESVVSWRIIVRAARLGDPRRPRAGQRFRMGQRVFHIDAVAERDGAGHWLTCFATEEVQA